MMTKSEFENIAKSMIGKKVRQVTYHEINYFDNCFHFFDDSRFDSIDCAIDLVFHDNSNMTITWGTEFIQYGISLLANPLEGTTRNLDVTQVSRWRNSIGKRIIDCQVFWSWYEENKNGSFASFQYPQDILINFEYGGTILVSVLDFYENDRFMGMMDNIIVFHDIELAKHLKYFG